jgi:hypothetical protein
MSTPNRQIGWSQESNLLSYISKQLDKLNGTVAATAAGGLLNPTTNYIPFNSGLAFGDSYLFNDTDILKTVWNTTDKGLKLDFLNEQYTLGRESTEYLRVQTELIYSNYQGSDIGLKLDFASNNYRLGDVTAGNGSYVEVDGWNIYLKGSNNNTWFEIDDNNSTIKSTYGGTDIGLKLDFANNIFSIGDYAQTIPSPSLIIDLNTKEVKVNDGNVDSGIILDYSNYKYSFGQINGLNQTTFIVDDNNSLINTSYGGNDIGLKLDFANNVYGLGDFNNSNNACSFVITSGPGNDTWSTYNSAGNEEGIKLGIGSYLIGNSFTGPNPEYFGIDTANNTLIGGVNLTSGTAGGASGQYLKIKLNGTDYKIALLNNA